MVAGLSDKDVWQHVAVVYEADGTVTGYLNGKKSQTAYSAFDFAGVKAGIGAPYLNYAVPFEGDLDDFRIHNRALGEKDIKAAVILKTLSGDPVPDCVGLTETAARAAIVADGFTVRTVTYEYF